MKAGGRDAWGGDFAKAGEGSADIGDALSSLGKAYWAGWVEVWFAQQSSNALKLDVHRIHKHAVVRMRDGLLGAGISDAASLHVESGFIRGHADEAVGN